MTADPRPPVDLVEGETLAAVASLWRKTGRELRARFGGTSMEPALPPGTEVVLRCGETGGPGHVIAFLAEGRLVVHRVVARAADGSWTLTRGDARILPDMPIRDPEAVLGRVTGVWREGTTLGAVPAVEDSTPARWATHVFTTILRASPAAGSAALRSIHTAFRLLRTSGLMLRRRRA